jgi:DNA-binding transcriptional MerR regulator
VTRAALAAAMAISDNAADAARMTDEPSENEFTIDELAAAARVTNRTIRYYQGKGALPGPKIRGRTAYYGAEHVERLKLIGTLQDRGLTMRAIRDLLAQADKGELALNEWLGLEQRLQEPWANDRPRVVGELELDEMLGGRVGARAVLVRLGQLERQGDSYIVRSPTLLQVALRLDAAGVDFETSVGAAAILRKHLHRATDELTAYFYKRIGEGFGRDATAQGLGAAYEALRPLGLEALRVVFAQEMERALRKLLDSGATSELPAKARRKKRTGGG